MFKLFGKVEAWIHKQPPIVSSISHGLLVSVLIAIGSVLTWISSLVDPDLPIRFDIWSYGFGIGAYFLREFEDYKRYAAKGDSKGQLDSVLDLWVPVVMGTFTFAVLFGASLA